MDNDNASKYFAQKLDESMQKSTEMMQKRLYNSLDYGYHGNNYNRSTFGGCRIASRSVHLPSLVSFRITLDQQWLAVHLREIVRRCAKS